MKFGSSITLLKQCIVKGTALILICMSGVVEAAIWNVSNHNDSGPGSLRAAVASANTDATPPQISFTLLALPDTIPLTTGALSISPVGNGLTINGLPGLSVNNAFNPNNFIFQIADGINVVLNTALDVGGANTNWNGSISTGANSSVAWNQSVAGTYQGKITGLGSFTLNGGNPLTLANMSTYTGGTTILAGNNLVVGVTNALPTSGSVAVNGGTLTINPNFSQTLGQLTGTGTVNIGANGNLTLFSATNATFSGNITGTGALVQQGTNIVSLANTSDYTGGTRILGGTLQVAALNALPTAGPVTIASVGTLRISANQTLKSIAGTGAVLVDNAIILTMNTVADSTFAGNITTTGNGLFVNGANHTLTLSGTNSGNLGITAGTVKIPAGGSWTGPAQIANSTLEMNGGIVTGVITGDTTPASNLNVTNNFTPTAAITDVGTITVRANGNLTLNTGSVPTGFTAFNVDAVGTLNLNTNFTVPANATFTNTGTFVMKGFNLLMGDNAIFNSNSNLMTTGSIQPSGLATTYTVNVGNNSTLAVNNPISGYAAFNVITGGTAALNNGGSLSTVSLNNGTFTINGGTVTGNITQAGAPSILNINTAFSAPATIDVHTLNVNNGGTFTPNNTVTVQTALNVNQGGTLLFTNDIGGPGTIVDAGTITHTTNEIRTINGSFTLESTGIINLAVTGTNPLQYSKFQVNGLATTLNGGTINVELPTATTTINTGDVLDVLTSANAITANTLPKAPTVSLFVDFTPSIVNNGHTLRLTATRVPFDVVNDIPALEGTALNLDSLRASNPLNPLVLFADGITSQSEFETFLEQSAPTGLNGMYTAQAMVPTDQVILRLDTMRKMGLRGALARTGYVKTGYAAGDMMEDQGSYGPLLFGSSAKQSNRAGLTGYDAFTAGFGMLFDVPILQYFRVGFGATYANSAVKQSDNTGSNTTIGNTQGVAYGSATYESLFLDAVLSAGINNYHTKRNITLIGETATSAYLGSQYSAKVKTGFTIPCYQVEFSPTAALQYLHLNVNAYTEQGAPNENRSVDAMPINTTRAYLGGRIADRSQEEDFFPEIHAYYIVDIKNPTALITSRFVAGGGSFVSQGVQAPKSGINVGASITALLSDNFLISGAYDLEAKTSFKSHTLGFKFKYLF